MTVATRRDDGEHGEQPRRSLEQDHRSLGVLHRCLGVGQFVALEHRELAEVVRQIAVQRRFQLGDLLGRVTGASQRGNVELVEQAETLDGGEGAGNERQQIDGDGAILDGDAVDQPITREQLHQRRVGSFHGVGQELLHLGVADHSGQGAVDERLGTCGQRRCQPVEVAREHGGDPRLHVDGREQLIGHPRGEPSLDLGVGQGGRHDVADLVANRTPWLGPTRRSAPA